MGSLIQAASTARALVLGWVVPSLIGVSIFSFFLLPRIGMNSEILGQISTMGWAERATSIFIFSLIFGLLLHAAQTMLYRVLEGYLWPDWLRKVGTSRQLRKKTNVKTQYEHARDVVGDQISMAILLEKYRRFPAEDVFTLPTRFGNSIRAAELYGWDRYRLDVVSFWYQALASSPDKLRDDEDRARSSMDFQVCSLYISLILAIFSAVSVWGSDGLALGSLILGTVFSALAFVFYQGAIMASREWSRSLEAIADLCRIPLASSLGLKLPSTIEEEREMWRAVGFLVKYPYTQNRSDKLKPFALKRK
jgi:hypothetical protein